MTTSEGSGRVEHEIVLSAERLHHEVVRVPRERVRISKRIVTEIRTLQVPVRVEQLVVRHEPVGGVGPATGSRQAPADLELVLHEEVPVVSLQVRPTERVRIRVDQVAGRQQVTEILRHEEVDLTVDELPHEAVTGPDHDRVTGT